MNKKIIGVSEWKKLSEVVSGWITNPNIAAYLMELVEDLITRTRNEAVENERERITKILDGKGFVDYEDLNNPTNI